MAEHTVTLVENTHDGDGQMSKQNNCQKRDSEANSSFTQDDFSKKQQLFIYRLMSRISGILLNFHKSLLAGGLISINAFAFVTKRRLSTREVILYGSYCHRFLGFDTLNLVEKLRVF